MGMHETMDVHEILNFKTVCLLKSKLMQGVVFDQDLRALMQKDVEQSIRAIKELKDIYKTFKPTAESINGGGVQ
ncbi:spore coat protein [Peribacillus deserti]|nr:spore coat protein [Peribacillus deserti]